MDLLCVGGGEAGLTLRVSRPEGQLGAGCQEWLSETGFGKLRECDNV
jgi:hypothetical protein